VISSDVERSLVKAVPLHTIEALRREGVQLLLFLDLGTRWGEWSTSRPGRPISQERNPSTHWIGGWVGLRAGLGTETREKAFGSARDRTPIAWPSSP
jgi:hypothetical protein